jgi:hypothetical protein
MGNGAKDERWPLIKEFEEKLLGGQIKIQI